MEKIDFGDGEGPRYPRRIPRGDGTVEERLPSFELQPADFTPEQIRESIDRAFEERKRTPKPPAADLT